jgi:hypothetical protein
MARRLFPNENPVGQRLRFSRRDPFMEIVGVARGREFSKGKYRSLREAPRMCLYEPFLMGYRHQMNLLVRAEGDPQSLLAGVRQAVQALDPRLPLFNVRSLTEQVRIGPRESKRSRSGHAARAGASDRRSSRVAVIPLDEAVVWETYDLRCS